MLVIVTRLHIKKQNLYSERNEEKREEFREILEQLELDGASVVWVDEVGIDEYYHRTHGRAPAGEKVIGEIPGKKYERTNIVAGLSQGKVVAPFEYKGTTNSVLFEYWFEHQLLSTIMPNSVISLDNASFHRKSVLLELAAKKDCIVVFIPAYSPDLNPIETTVWANLKNFLRNYMKLYDSLRDAVSEFFQFK